MCVCCVLLLLRHCAQACVEDVLYNETALMIFMEYMDREVSSVPSSTRVRVCVCVCVYMRACV